MSKQKLYFAHPINTYDTPLEKSLMELTQKKFPDFEIENPNQPHHQKGYAEYKEKFKNTPGKSGMTYFYELLESCEAGTIALPFLDGKIGAGVAGEMIFQLKIQRDCFLIIPPELNSIYRINQKAKKLLLQWGDETNFTEKKLGKDAMENIENQLVLSINETRKRTWVVLYKKLLPYEKAHLRV